MSRLSRTRPVEPETSPHPTEVQLQRAETPGHVCDSAFLDSTLMIRTADAATRAGRIAVSPLP
jgi:hypothetical protein